MVHCTGIAVFCHHDRVLFVCFFFCFLFFSSGLQSWNVSVLASLPAAGETERCVCRGRRPRRREMDVSSKTVREAQLSCEMSKKTKWSNVFWNCLKMLRDAFNSATNPFRIRNLSRIRFSSSVSVASLSIKVSCSCGSVEQRAVVSFTVVKLAAHWVNAAFSPAPGHSASLRVNRGGAWTWSLGFHVMIGWSEPPFDGQWSSFECSTVPQRAELTYKYIYF